MTHPHLGRTAVPQGSAFYENAETVIKPLEDYRKGLKSPRTDDHHEHMMLLLSFHSAAFHAGTARVATNARLSSSSRTSTPTLYLDSEAPVSLSGVQWLKSENGLSFKELDAGSGVKPEPTQTVAIAYKASYLSSGEIIEETAKSRPLVFTLESGGGGLPMFQEAVDGMAVGGTRRVMLPPSCKYSSLDEETVQFDFELVAVKTAPEAALFKVQQAIGANRNLIRLALLSTFLPDILNLFGALPDSGAPLSDVATAAAQHPVALDAANRWAESTLSLFN